jgi:hypothetical protein
MTGARYFLVLLLLVAGSFSSACKKKSPHALQLPSPGPAAKSAPVDPLPAPSIDLPESQPNIALEPPSVNFPPPPRRRGVRKPRKAPAASATAAPVRPEPDEEPVESGPPLPQLGEVLSEQQQRDYSRDIEQSVSRTKQMLDQVRDRNLSGRQLEIYGQIRGFLKQVDGAKKTDLVFSRTVALRAEILARDLVDSVR